MGTCPKCGAKLKKTDWRPNCWNCGVNIMYYGMEDRLEADAQRAEKEFDKFYHMTAGMMLFHLAVQPDGLVGILSGQLAFGGIHRACPVRGGIRAAACDSGAGRDPDATDKARAGGRGSGAEGRR